MIVCRYSLVSCVVRPADQLFVVCLLLLLDLLAGDGDIVFCFVVVVVIAVVVVVCEKKGARASKIDLSSSVMMVDIGWLALVWFWFGLFEVCCCCVRSTLPYDYGEADRIKVSVRIKNVLLNVLPTLRTTQRKTFRAAGYHINMAPSTLWRRCKENGNSEDGPRRISIHQKPILTEANEQQRIDYAIAQVDECGDYFKSQFDVVHVDEKWFNMYEASYSCILGPGEGCPNQQARNKRYIGKCMFLCAVARP